MSDDDELHSVKNKKAIHYGSLEENERIRLQSTKLVPPGEEEFKESDALRRSDIPESNTAEDAHVSDEYMDLEEELSKDKKALLEEFERRKKARQVNVSTDDFEVKKNLRKLGEPICIFGEGPAERRNRLRDLFSRLGDNALQKKQDEEDERIQQEKDQETTWYHEGPLILKSARLWISNYSLPRAHNRIKSACEEAHQPEASSTARKQELQKFITSLGIYCSQIGDTRPLSFCSFSPDSTILATASWSGLCKLWSVPDCQPLRTLKGHTCNVGAVVFHPRLNQEETLCALASCSVDGAVKLWTLESEDPLADIEGHEPHRVSRIEFHPSGRFLGTCCFDCSWRLWDLEIGQEVLHQEGHCKPVYCICFQNDGSVAATGGMDAFGRVWDLRTGRCVMFMEGHLKAVYGIDFSPDGYHIATGSEDNTCRIWDLRKRACIYTIPAHMNLLSHVKYQKCGGHFLITSSYDNTAKVWSNNTWQSLKTLHGHDGKVMCLDITPDSNYIATCSYDRTFKLWAPE